jgi:hypothetical protein
MSFSSELREWWTAAKELWLEDRQKRKNSPYWYWLISAIADLYVFSQMKHC